VGTPVAAASLRTDNSPQPKEAQPLSHAPDTRLIQHLKLLSGEGALRWRCFPIHLVPRLVHR
jgi:hypothetical protein